MLLRRANTGNGIGEMISRSSQNVSSKHGLEVTIVAVLLVVYQMKGMHSRRVNKIASDT